MLPTFTVSIVLVLVTHATARAVAFDYSTFSFISSLQSNTSVDCDATCAPFKAMEAKCNTPHCGCTVSFVQAQGDCLVCQVDAPADAANVQFLLDAEMQQCYSEGIQIDVRLQLPPAAAAIVQKIDHQSRSLRRYQDAFLALQIAGGHIGLVVLILYGIFSRKVDRDPTFYNFCITWVFSSISNSIQLYGGTKYNTVINPLGSLSIGTCKTQAALINGVQFMTVCSTLAWIIRLWLALRSAVRDNLTHRFSEPLWVIISLVAVPYIGFMAFFLPSVFISRQHFNLAGVSFERALPTRFYCMVMSPNFMRVLYGMTLSVLVLSLMFDVLVVEMLYRNWRGFRRLGGKSPISLSILLRVVFFSCFRSGVAVACGMVLYSPPTMRVSQGGISLILPTLFGFPEWMDILQASIPLVAFLVLGINDEMISALMFWRTMRLTPLRNRSALPKATVANIDKRPDCGPPESQYQP